MKLDRIDRKLLELLQSDSTIALDELARQVHLTPAPTWRRINKLEGAGVIEKRVALCNAEMLGVAITVFVNVRTSRHDPAWLQQFVEGVKNTPQVTEFYRMSGDVDYLLKVVVPDVAEYDAVYRHLIQIAELSGVSSSFALERIKYTTALPVRYAE